MKLELKHLAPYLPYGLKCVFYHNDNTTEICEITMASKNGIGYDDEEYYKNNLNTCYYKLTKPILRPLSDLSKSKFKDMMPIEINIDEDLSIWSSDIPFAVVIDFNEYYEAVTFSFKNHFDVFGLIEKGLAIDINTINN